MSTIPTQRGGRRDRGMQQKRNRIQSAATELFDEFGFEAVTTQRISDLADVAAGTLFRYASSKSELLLMAYNDKLRAAVREGKEAAEAIDEPLPAIVALVEPLVARAAEWPENSAAYQRELLFGSPDEKFRVEGLELVAELEAAIAAQLTANAESPSVGPDEARLAASSIFAVVHLTIARLFTGAHADHDPSSDMRRQICQIIAGVISSPALVR